MLAFRSLYVLRRRVSNPARTDEASQTLWRLSEKGSHVRLERELGDELLARLAHALHSADGDGLREREARHWQGRQLARKAAQKHASSRVPPLTMVGAAPSNCRSWPMSRRAN
eukprot:6207611-Pleurochrysis_carterae.AAC.2